MGIFSRFERKVEDGFDNVNDKLFDSPISPVQIAKKAEKQMRREKMVGAGKEFAPTLYTILVNPDDDDRLFGYYPTLAGETETYLKAKAQEEGLAMDGAPLVRFIVDDELKPGRFEVIAEMVSAPIIAQLRAEEMQRYGLQPSNGGHDSYPYNNAQNMAAQPVPQPAYEQQFTPSSHNYGDDFEQVYIPMDDPMRGIDVMAEDVHDDYYQSYDAGYGTPDTKQFPDEMPGAPMVAPNNHNQGTAHVVNLVTGRNFVLAKPVVVIGRGVNCDIVLDDLNASRMHAEFRELSPSTWQISDLGSTNGTLVNGRHIAEVILNEGDRISVGTTTFVFTYN